MSDDTVIDVLADFLLRKGPMNIEPLAVRQRLSRELLDLVDAQRAALAATPAVGGEALANEVAIAGHLRIESGRLLSPSEKSLVVAALRAQPASPLRGREEIAVAVRKVLDDDKWPEYRMQDDNGLKDYEYVNFIMDVFAKLSASPPEQPITMEQVVDWLNANTSSYTMQPRDRPHAQND